ncbi:MAG: heat-inducible transcriptional repressor HrcA, partial [Gammaproteobacteria bacterium]|nr:heat-inducible transcriptional repressor HrcA [Gammaproteobacteria bacterium]
SLSSATIRHVMSDLEKWGYITSPHTSAGRIPTEQAYRLVVDELLTAGVSQYLDDERLAMSLNPNQPTSGLLEEASSLLSDMTRFAGIVTLPKRNKVHLRHIEFLPLSDKRVLAILVFGEKEVQNRILQMDKPYSTSELQQVANYVNQHFTGKDLLTIRERIFQSLNEDYREMNDLIKNTLDMASQIFEQETEQEQCFVAGQSHLLHWANTADLERLKTLFEVFTQKQNILSLFDRCLQADRMQIFIGKEAGNDMFDQLSVVVSPYEMDGEILGMLGVIGPTRMPYNQVIPVVNLTARLLNDALNN